jgi:tetratricopeptide (TPR) repeat protein
MPADEPKPGSRPLTGEWEPLEPPPIPLPIEAMSDDRSLGRIDRYVLEEEIGRGGMGVVYRAHNRENEHLRVALKTIRPEFAHSRMTRERFLRERRTLAQIKSDHVVRVYDTFESGELPYLVMELLEGEPLSGWLERQPDQRGAPADALRIAGDVLRGLKELHDRHLIHRDIKPGNLWVEQPSGRVKVLDLGLAREAEGDDLTRAAGLNRPVGTPSFMSPEQSRCEPLGPASDLFSVGTVLYRFLTGENPFFRATATGVVDVDATLEAVQTFEPKPLATRVPGVPAPLADLVERLLKKRPSDRPADATAALAELTRAQERIAAPAGASDLPPRPALVGRDDLLARVERWFAGSGPLALTGQFGIGKTVLAAAAAHALRDRAVAVVWVSGERARRFEGCLRRAAAALLGDRHASSPVEQLKELVADELAARRGLLVIDRLDALEDYREAVAWLAGLPPAVRALVTAQANPQIAGGQTLVVSVLDAAAAGKLFRARFAADGRSADGLDPATVDRLCAQVGHHPLAVELLADRAREMPLAALLKRVEAGLNHLNEHSAGGTLIPNAVQVCFNGAVAALDPAARDLLGRMSVLPAPFDLELAADTGAEPPYSAAARLVRASLWRMSDDNERYAVHPLVRQLARGLVPSPPAAVARLTGRAAELALGLWTAAAGGRDRHRARACADWCAAELPNLTALVDAAKPEADAAVVALAVGLEPFWPARGFWDVAERLYRTAAAAAERRGDWASAARCLENRGYAYRHLGRFAAADAAYRSVLALCDAHPAETAAVRPLVLARYGKLLSVLDRHAEAETHLSAAVELYRASDNSAGLTAATIDLAQVHKFAGRADRAAELLTHALNRARAAGDPGGEAKCQYQLGNTYLRTREFGKARAALRDGLRLAREAEDRVRESQCLVGLGLAEAHGGTWPEAERYLTEGLQLARTLGLRLHEGHSLRRVAELLFDRGEPERAREFAREAVAVLAASEDSNGAAAARAVLGRIEHAIGRAPAPAGV